MKKYMLIAGVLLQAVFASGVKAEAQMPEWAKKTRGAAVGRVAVQRGIGLPGSVPKVLKPGAVSQGLPPVVPPRRFADAGRSPVANNQAVKALAEKLARTKEVADEEGYYTVYLSVPRETVMSHLFLTRLQNYLESKGYAQVVNPGSLITYIAETVKKPLRVELDVNNLFVPAVQQLTLKRQAAFGVPQRLSVRDWPRLAPYVQDKTRAELATFLNRYMDRYGYDRDILVQLFIPKDQADSLVTAKFAGNEYALDQLMQADEGLAKRLKDSYVMLRLQPDVNYDDLVTLVVHSLKSSPASEQEKASLGIQLGALIQKVGSETFASLKNPPVPLPRDIVVQPARALGPPPVVPPRRGRIGEVGFGEFQRGPAPAVPPRRRPALTPPVPLPRDVAVQPVQPLGPAPAVPPRRRPALTPPVPLPRDVAVQPVQPLGPAPAVPSRKRKIEDVEFGEFQPGSAPGAPSRRFPALTPPVPLPRDVVVQPAEPLGPAPAVPSRERPRVVTFDVLQEEAVQTSVAKPAGPLSFLEQIQQGRQLKKVEPISRPLLEKEKSLRDISQAIERLRLPEEMEIDEESSEGWEETPSPVRYQAPTRPSQVPPVIPPRSRQPEIEEQPSVPRLQGRLQELLGARLQQRRGALAEDDEDAMDEEDWGVQ